MIAVHVRYEGRVQGVGFRQTVKVIACKHVVTGWVRNLPDGGVELLVEGERAEVEAFLDKIGQRFQGHIRVEDRSPRDPTGGFTKFEIA